MSSEEDLQVDKGKPVPDGVCAEPKAVALWCFTT